MSTYVSTFVAALPKLRVLGSGGAKSFDVQYGQNIVGRSEDCGLHLDLPSLSLEHAIIRFEEDGTASVEDLKSTNKTMLGSLDEPLELDPGEMYPLNHGDTLVFGDVVCVFILPGAPGGNQSLRSPIRGGGMSTMTAESTRLGAKTAPSMLDATRSPSSTLRPATTAFSREEHDTIRDQMELLMSGMTHLYSVINGDATGQHSMTVMSPASNATRRQRSDLEEASLPQNVYVSSPAAGRSAMSTRGSGMEQTYASQEYPFEEEGQTVSGLMRHAKTSPQRPALSGRDNLHLYSSHGMTPMDHTAASRDGAPRFPSRGGAFTTSTSTVDLVQHEVVKFGRYWLPEACITLILSRAPRVPNVLRMAAVNRQMRRLCTNDRVWRELDISWNTLTPDPICMRMTDQVLQTILDRWFRFNIRHLNLSGCSFVTDWTLQMLSRYLLDTNIIDLHCIADVGPAITDAGMVELMRKAPKTEVINLSWCGKIGNLSIKTIADSCPNLTSIDVTGCTLISDSSVVALANSYAGPRLVDLKLQSCELITATAVSAIAQRCTSLTMLNIGGCERVGGSSIAQLIENCPRLVDMDLTQCHHLTDTNLRAMAPYFTQIQKIRLGYCRNVTEEGFRDVARFCFELVHADVRGLRKLSDGSVVKLSQVARWLSHLDIRGCQGISKDGIDKVSRNLEMCNVVYSRVG